MAYSPAKHHWGVGRGLAGPSVLFRALLEEEERHEEEGGVSLCLLYEPQKSAALVNKRPAYQWRGEGGAGGTAFRDFTRPRRRKQPSDGGKV